jgi:hypothetical protein
MLSKVYSNGTYRVEVREDGAILVKPGDWLSKYSAAIYNNFTTLDVFVRPAPDETTVPIADRNVITAGETILHKPTWDTWRNKRGGQPGGGSPSTGPVQPRAMYDRGAAVAYARRWAKGHNREFEKALSDDVNFLSQCLLAGGWPMVSRKPDGGDHADQSVWWYDDSRPRGLAMNASNTWFKPLPLTHFLYQTNRATSYQCVYQSDSNGVGRQYGWPGWLRSHVLRPGDLIQLACRPFHPYQSMIVTDTSGNSPDKVRVCFHAAVGRNMWSNGLDVPFSEFLRTIVAYPILVRVVQMSDSLQ